MTKAQAQYPADQPRSPPALNEWHIMHCSRCPEPTSRTSTGKSPCKIKPEILLNTHEILFAHFSYSNEQLLSSCVSYKQTVQSTLIYGKASGACLYQTTASPPRIAIVIPTTDPTAVTSGCVKIDTINITMDMLQECGKQTTCCNHQQTKNKPAKLLSQAYNCQRPHVRSSSCISTGVHNSVPRCGRAS